NRKRMAMAPELRIMDDPPELAREAADLFVWLAEQAVETTGQCRLALSGGSTPKLLYAELAGPAFRSRLDWTGLEFYFGDERCVPPDHPESNFALAEKDLFRPLKVEATRIFRMPGEVADPERGADHYAALLRRQFQASPPAVPVFDIILLGLGADGHTASLFPESDTLRESSRLVRPAVSPQGVRQRLTLTLPVLNQARTVLFLVSGAAKARAVAAVLEDHAAKDTQWPARLVRPAKGRLVWILDRPAASELAVARQGIVSHEE
ncbi:MAG: 6-phosphogluconolactonase, partial [Nitrospirales bacterium]